MTTATATDYARKISFYTQAGYTVEQEVTGATIELYGPDGYYVIEDEDTAFKVLLAVTAAAYGG